MGVWGTGLYQNDISLDVKDEFMDALRSGGNPEKITANMIEEYFSIIDDPDEAPFFWFALADVQWKMGVLLPDVKEKTLCWIDRGGDATLWGEYPSLMAKRKKVIESLKCELHSPQPPRKDYKIPKLYKCEWNNGDVYAYHLESEHAKEAGLCGKYLLIQKVDNKTWHPGHIIPIVYIKMSDNAYLPTNKIEYDKLEYIQVSHSVFQEVKWPDWMPPVEEIVAREAREKKLLDEYGFLPEFRVSLISTSKKAIPSNLIYVGNFIGAKLPSKEYIPSNMTNLLSLTWKEFEESLIDRYFGYNKRQYTAYKKRSRGQGNGKTGDGFA